MITSEHVNVDADRVPEAGAARVGPRITGSGVLDHEEARRDVTLLRDDTHAPSRRVVGYNLQNNEMITFFTQFGFPLGGSTSRYTFIAQPLLRYHTVAT